MVLNFTFITNHSKAKVKRQMDAFRERKAKKQAVKKSSQQYCREEILKVTSLLNF